MPSRRARSRNYAVYRSFSNKVAEAALLPVYLARRRRKVHAADADADGDNEEGEVLEADAELQKRRKTEDAVAVLNVAEDVRIESDGGAFLVGPCNGEVCWKAGLILLASSRFKLDCCEPFVPTTRQYYIPFIYNIADIIFRAGSLTGRVGDWH
jgi:hypothetical protein